MKEQIWQVHMELIQVYSRIPGVLVSELVYAVTLWINSFTSKDGVSTTLIPRAIITGQSIEFNKHCLLKFVEYVHTQEYGYNSMESHTFGALAIHTTGSL